MANYVDGFVLRYRRRRSMPTAACRARRGRSGASMARSSTGNAWPTTCKWERRRRSRAASRRSPTRRWSSRGSCTSACPARPHQRQGDEGPARGRRDELQGNAVRHQSHVLGRLQGHRRPLIGYSRWRCVGSAIRGSWYLRIATGSLASFHAPPSRTSRAPHRHVAPRHLPDVRFTTLRLRLAWLSCRGRARASGPRVLDSGSPTWLCSRAGGRNCDACRLFDRAGQCAGAGAPGCHGAVSRGPRPGRRRRRELRALDPTAHRAQPSAISSLGDRGQSRRRLDAVWPPSAPGRRLLPCGSASRSRTRWRGKVGSPQFVTPTGALGGVVHVWAP